MVDLLLATVLSSKNAHAIPLPEDVNKLCSYIVGIPYASDNFDDSQFERFELCRKLINQS